MDSAQVAANSRKQIHVGAAFRFAITWFAKHPVPMLVIALPSALFGIAYLVATTRDLPVLSFLLSFATIFVGEITTAALTFAFFLASRDQHFSPASTYQHVFDRLETLIAYTFRYWGAVFLLCITVIGIPWAIRLFVRWFFGSQTVILTNASAKEAIAYSCRLVGGNWWRVARLFLLFIVLAIPNSLLTYVWPRGLTAGLITATIGFVATSFFAGFWTAIYLQLDEQERAILASQPAAP